MIRLNSYVTSPTRTHLLELPPPTEEAWSWQRRGSCLSYPVDLFFPDDRSRKAVRRQENAAKIICRQCPVLEQCRDHALRTPEHHGIWGAMTAAERARELLGRELPVARATS